MISNPVLAGSILKAGAQSKSTFPVMYIRDMLAETMNRNLGVVRDGDTMEQGIRDVDYYISAAGRINYDNSVNPYDNYSLPALLCLAKTPPYMESFLYDGPKDNTVAGLLEYLNYNDDIITIEGNKTTRITWDCSCIQGICGACAMLINDRPALACETFLRDLPQDEITIRPLTKFPVICDLMVDRSSIRENLRKNNVFIGTYRPMEKKDEKEHENQYNAAKCLKCGLCLEICPKYKDGGDFFGAAFANDCYLVAARSGEQKDKVKEAYDEHFKKDCAYDLACMDICPMGIKMTASMAMLNRMK